MDDGAAAGTTTTVAGRDRLRNQPTKPKRLIIALPVNSKEIATRLQQECDRLEIITKPSSGFRSVTQYYQDFGQSSDEKVIQIMNNRITDKSMK